jgi:hypothetical protein
MRNGKQQNISNLDEQEIFIKVIKKLEGEKTFRLRDFRRLRTNSKSQIPNFFLVFLSALGVLVVFLHVQSPKFQTIEQSKQALI